MSSASLPRLRIILAACVPLASAAHLATGPHLDSFPDNWRVMALVAFLYAPAVALLVASLASDGAVRWVLQRRVVIPVFLSVPLSALMAAASIDRGADFVLGSILSCIGMALIVIMPPGGAPTLRRYICRGLAAMTLFWLVTSLAFAGLVQMRTQAFSPSACLYTHDPDTIYDVLPVKQSTWPLLFQRLLADRPAEPYSVAYRLELRDGHSLYHWSMRRLDFVPTIPDSITNLEVRTCPIEETP